ncbi:stress responsive alpha-beta barrel domain-containing protein [Siphonobacter sp. SORGH_AS_0500]|uniref:Dabb family protein n=1 Tax=Siphonobacter sp. SORGH_AS_0500 TaxID=1864824 RepID=UPI000CAA4823|nr:Dabb family protein [Siphonobacter sp. SORGH_AS_0500]PKK37164.1 stress responsive alpha-beta barrel domain-containing protein [Siphonobacter sp. SORGH_AS_0500]
MKNTRRTFLASSLTLAAGTAVTMAAPVHTEKAKYPLVHHVFFWLKNPGSVADRDKIIAGLKTLRKIEAIKELRIGIVANTEKRDVVDQSWAVSELMFFENEKDQASYQTHPIHQQFIKDCSALWDKVVVYDAIDV